MPSPRWTGTTSRLLSSGVEGKIWSAWWSMPSGHQFHSTLDLSMTEKLTRMSVGTDRHQWAGEDPVGLLREPMPNGHHRHWLAQLWSLWRAILVGAGPARW